MQSKGITIYSVQDNHIVESFHEYADHIHRQQIIEVLIVGKGTVQVELKDKFQLPDQWTAVLLNSNLIGYGLF